jgi:hypothetical protein
VRSIRSTRPSSSTFAIVICGDGAGVAGGAAAAGGAAGSGGGVKPGSTMPVRSRDRA